ncbi:helix-turn-helix domain-containing protein [Paenibacillus allorhizosphaerae]|nr:helix-turn-helix domain-containing protein [Paenibacillus allorhizosphaerae]
MVIADDESLARVSLSSMIKEMGAPWQIVGEAANGEELLTLVAQHTPDIALVDIRMPKLNGLDAVQLGKTVSPFTKWVILSGFSDFGYAQQALALGVSAYLLKPVDPAELERTVQHTYRDNKEYISLLNQQFENNLSALCNGLTTIEHEEQDSLLHRGSFLAWTFHVDAARPASQVSDVECELYKDLRQSMGKHLNFGMNLALLALQNGELAAVAIWDADKGEEGKQRVYDFFGETETIISRYRTADMTMTVLQTGECQGFKALNERLQQLQQWSHLRAVCGIGRRLEYAELMRVAQMPDKPEAARLLCDIGNHLQHLLCLNYHHAVSELEALLQKSPLFLSEKTKQAVCLFISIAIGIHLPENTTAAQLIAALRQHGVKVLRDLNKKESASVDLVTQVIQYIEKHYMDDIGIGQIAGQLNVSANYLSALFHKKTGVMFVKYLTRIRMHKAKELLMNTHLQVRQVAEQVGYYSTRHFTKLFTQTFGTYPSDYRKN